MDERLYVEQLIASSFVKYNRLGELIFKSFAGSSCTEINLFIDLNSVLKRMYSIDRWTYKFQGQYEIAATVINMCGHYRSFFRGLGVSTNIYIIYGLNCPNANSTYVSGYNSKFINSYIKKPDTTAMIEENLKILNIICQYLPKIYFFDIGDCEVSSMIDYLITATNSRARGFENIVVTKDVLALQLIPEHDVRVLRPVKTKNGDESYMISNANLWPSFINLYRKDKDPQIRISNTFFSNVLAMTRVPERSMYSVFPISKAIKVIDAAERSGFLDSTKFYNQATLNTALVAMDIQCNTTDLEMRYRAINTHFQSTYVLPLEKPEFKKLRLVDLDDPVGLKDLISKNFEYTPIDLDRL